MSALAEALVAAQRDLPLALGRDADGQIGSRSYKYLTLDKLIAQTRPILTDHGLAIVQEPIALERGDSWVPMLRTGLLWKEHDVPAIQSVMPLYLTDKTMQGLGAAITYARRYAWQSVLGIAAEEDTDGPADPTAHVPF